MRDTLSPKAVHISTRVVAAAYRPARCAAALVAAGYLGTAGIAHATPGLQLSASDNLVVNAGFADGLSGWDGHVYNATVDPAGAAVHDSGYIGQDVRVSKGATYAFSAQASAADQGSVLVLALDSGSGVNYVNQTVTSTAPQTVTGTFTAAGDTAYIACQATGGPGGRCTNFSIVPTPGASTACTGSAATGSASAGSACAASEVNPALTRPFGSAG
ncbi:carbohydrate binding domain-containing protein [Nocardia mexicana]|uniref:Carbohydrate binding protein n=1 Tax=Nocardia mexicana TaxID=279262 RepID=A0A370H9Q9_9NOCA|nr:carbohydrate binding domain-containing protein [Nocardia mexicana]RDI53412.1 carbohydrate binding protein [Nocardia mexicana]